MKTIVSNSIIKLTPDQIKSFILKSFKPGDKMHITKKSKDSISNEPVTFKSAFNHFITVEVNVNKYLRTYTITYSDLYTGNTVIQELLDRLEDYPSTSH